MSEDMNKATEAGTEQRQTEMRQIRKREAKTVMKRGVIMTHEHQPEAKKMNCHWKGKPRQGPKHIKTDTNAE